MKFANEDRTIPLRRRLLPVLVVIIALLATALAALAAAPLSVAGWLNHSYADPPNAISEPAGKGAESKLWFHDGDWWGVLFSPSESAFTIHRLDRASHDWVDTGVIVDRRIDQSSRAARSDVLWDGTKLYIASYMKFDNPSVVNSSVNWARLLRYSYDSGSRTWTVDPGYGDPANPDDPAKVTINRDISETLVLDKDSTGRLWITYVSRPQGSNTYSVYVNASTPDNQASWPSTAFVLPFPEATNVNMDDISALASFTDASGPKVAVMWSNQNDGDFHIAVRPDGAGTDAATGWTREAGLTNLFGSVPADDHIKLAKAPNNVLLAVVKTGAEPPPLGSATDPLIAVVRRAPNGTYSLHEVALVESLDTRPTMVVDQYQGKVHVFTVSKPTGGGFICMQSANLSDLQFDGPYNCPPPSGESETDYLTLAPVIAAVTPAVVIGDNTTYRNINDPTTAKHWLTEESGIAVLANDQGNPPQGSPPPRKVYAHNVLGGTTPPPPGDGRIYLPLIVR